jgi:ribonuclease HII
MVDTVRNKSNVLFSATAELLMEAWKKYAENSLQVIIDRQGGRVHYREHLLRLFEGAKLRILKETPSSSSYEITQADRYMRLHFVVKADNDYLPVSLASMVSKYLRELLVANINQYFLSFHPQLKPTAGYWKDGLRFLKDIKTNIPNLDYDHSMLIRSR